RRIYAHARPKIPSNLKSGAWKTGPNLPHGLIRQRDARGSPFSSLLSKMCSFAVQVATYKGRLLPAAPRTDPYGPNSGIRLLPRVSDGKALLRPWMKDFRLGKPVISDLFDTLPGDPTSLAASRQRAAPEVHHVMAECSDRRR